MSDIAWHGTVGFLDIPTTDGRLVESEYFHARRFPRRIILNSHEPAIYGDVVKVTLKPVDPTGFEVVACGNVPAELVEHVANPAPAGMFLVNAVILNPKRAVEFYMGSAGPPIRLGGSFGGVSVFETPLEVAWPGCEIHFAR